MMGMLLRNAQLRLITASAEKADVYEQLAWLSQLSCPADNAVSCRTSAAEAGALANQLGSNADAYGRSGNAVPSQGINTVRTFLCNALDTLDKVETQQQAFFEVGACVPSSAAAHPFIHVQPQPPPDHSLNRMFARPAAIV